MKREAGTGSSDARRRYNVVAEHDGRYWFLRVPELPGVFSQVRRLDHAERMARDAIASFLDVPSTQVDVSMELDLPVDLQRDVASVVNLRTLIERNEREYGELTRSLASRLVESEGLTTREVGRVLGISHQRVAQLVARG